MDEETVTVPKSDYEELKDDSRKLYYLVCGGVDNWEGYDSAMEEYWTEQDG